jgi:hypothetical protein
MARNCRREAAALIHLEALKFCDREPPENKSELSRRRRQASYLTSKISSISHADQMARNHPNVSDQILAETKAFLDRHDLDDSPYKGSMALTSKISTLCFSDMMQRT